MATPKLSEEQKKANKEKRAKETAERRASKGVNKTENKRGNTTIVSPPPPPKNERVLNIADFPKMRDIPESDRPKEYHILSNLLGDLSQPELKILLDRLKAMAQVTILEYEHYPDIVHLYGDVLSKDHFFEVAVTVNSYVSQSPFNSN